MYQIVSPCAQASITFHPNSPLTTRCISCVAIPRPLSATQIRDSYCALVRVNSFGGFRFTQNSYIRDKYPNAVSHSPVNYQPAEAELEMSSPYFHVILGGGLPWNRQRRVALPPSEAATWGSCWGNACGGAGTSVIIIKAAT
ncbi:hypothetical protein HW555_008336 [Spodoptera exigua]|uniref:Uncharacterized protein n=1 Tax=Spodoptera exigua TaxID=7107 RepID=A0A835L4J3_SPOEX|nr:hypothetical protein HW555_008336 [Spodoptera exigua]